MSVIEPLTNIFQEVFDDDDIALSREMTADDVDGWDSLSHINLIVTIESRFNFVFSKNELKAFKNVGDLISCIEQKVSS